jgi:hypothetical protein
MSMIDGCSQPARMSVDDVDRRQVMMLRNTPQMHVHERSSVCQARGWPASSGRQGTRWLAAAEAAVLRGALFFLSFFLSFFPPWRCSRTSKWAMEKVVLLMGMQGKAAAMCQTPQ